MRNALSNNRSARRGAAPRPARAAIESNPRAFRFSRFAIDCLGFLDRFEHRFAYYARGGKRPDFRGPPGDVRLAFRRRGDRAPRRGGRGRGARRCGAAPAHVGSKNFRTRARLVHARTIAPENARSRPPPRRSCAAPGSPAPERPRDRRTRVGRAQSGGGHTRARPPPPSARARSFLI